jgi:hypothetical protein
MLTVHQVYLHRDIIDSTECGTRRLTSPYSFELMPTASSDQAFGYVVCSIIKPYTKPGSDLTRIFTGDRPKLSIRLKQICLPSYDLARKKLYLCASAECTRAHKCRICQWEFTISIQECLDDKISTVTNELIEKRWLLHTNL